MSRFCICIGHFKNVLYLDVGHKINACFSEVHAIPKYGFVRMGVEFSPFLKMLL